VFFGSRQRRIQTITLRYAHRTRRLASPIVVWLLLSWLPAASRTSIAAITGDSKENYTIRSWQTQDGLPEQTVQAFAQTSDGYLWIGTTGGLLRFDGARFVTFERGNTPAFLQNSVFTLMTSHDGSLWIGTEGGGLIRNFHGQFERISVANGLTDGFVRTVLEDRQGVIWIGTDNGLFQLSDAQANHVTRVDGTAEIPAVTVHSIAEVRDGTVWVGGSRLIAFAPGSGSLNQRAKNFDLMGEYGETLVKTILQTRDGAIWVGTVSGLQRMLPGSSEFQRIGGIRSTVRCMRETGNPLDGAPEKSHQQRILWIGTIGQGAFIWRDGIVSPAPEAPGLPSRTVLSLFEDSENNMWMGTQVGMLRFSKSPMHLVPLPNASDSDFETVSLDRDGSMWVGSTYLTHVVNGVATPFVFPELHGARVRNVFRDSSGSLWIGTDGRGLFWLKPGSAPRQFTTEDGLVNSFVRAIMQARDGTLWVATDGGVSRFSGGRFRSFRMEEGLAYSSVRSIVEDRDGQIWIGTDRGLSTLRGDSFTQNAATRGLSAEKVWAIHQSASGALWFGTRDGGLYRYFQEKLTHYTTEQGLASNSIYSILGDGQGRFWISGARGVISVAIAELESPLESAHGYLSQRLFGISETGGLPSLYGGTQPAGAITPDGNVWFPTSKGPVTFTTRDMNRSVVPRVFIDQITADGQKLTLDSGIHLAADSTNLEIDFGAVLLGQQDAVQFQYRLEGFDPEWRFAGAQRTAHYTNLPAGSYTFRVRAFQGGAEQRTEQTITIEKREYFYRTWWFLSLCIAAAALVVTTSHYLRLRRVRTAFQAVLDERARLAREMHDTLIQGCTGVSLLLEAYASAKDRQVQGELVNFARTQLAASIDEARQALWNLRGTYSTNFAENLQKLAERTERGSNIGVHCAIEGDTYEFHSAAMHEIMMVSREAIYNALLHANPTRIDVHAHFGANRFGLTIKDDGSGFEVSHITDGHYGLIGIHERIKRLGGIVRVTSGPSIGTEILVELPRAAIDQTQEQFAEVHQP
jgi:ligand-binding sensor domain-containing protein/signal transduction histidine kinase